MREKRGSSYMYEWTDEDRILASNKMDSDTEHIVKMGLVFSGKGLSDIREWRRISSNEIEYETYDGERFVYSFITNEIRYITDCVDDNGEIDDGLWKEIFTNNLRRLIIKNGETQRSLANGIGVSLVSINKYVNGRAIPSAFVLHRMAKHFNCSVNDILP